MDIPGGQVLRYPRALVFVLDARGLMRPDRPARVTTTTHLNAGLLIGAEHVFIRPERLTLPVACVQVENWTSQL
jgi:hypothetical protein